jgi:Aerotolerance regulator N-terminal
MSFLQPMLLLAAPLVALPIIIHLINQRRYQTVRWAAMMFLLAANRMSRGYARIRQWLIMAMRMAAIGGLIFAISRPLAGGWLGLAGGGRAETTIVLVDRSPSMHQTGAGTGGSKLETGLAQLSRTLATLGSARWVLIDSTTNQPRELDAIDELPRVPSTGPSSASADIPGMLQAARDYVKANKVGRTEVWICSDDRSNDWGADSGRWQALRDEFQQFPQGVRFHLLAYPQPAQRNLAVRVTEVRRQKTGDAAELLVSLKLTRQDGGEGREPVPVRFEIDGARSEVTVDLAGPEAELKDHRIPLEKGKERGWGRVSIPADSNSADNDFWFVFEPPVARRTIVVAEDATAARPLELAASISPDPSVKCTAEVLAPGQLSGFDWDRVALLLWQAPLPDKDTSAAVTAFIERGGSAIFFPPRGPDANTLYGAHWTTWQDQKGEAPVEGWRGDEDLLAHTQSGASLPVGQLQVRRACGLSGGELTTLATLKGGAPLLARAATDGGAAYFCCTTPAGGDSSMAAGGVVLYVMLHRAMVAGAASLGTTRQLVAGEPLREDPAHWERIAGGDEAISTEYAAHRGVYASGGRLLAVNRSAAEDSASLLADPRIDDLFRGLDYSRVDGRAGSSGSLIQEIWRMFLVAMVVALVVEAALCLPKLARPQAPSSFAGAASFAGAPS